MNSSYIVTVGRVRSTQTLVTVSSLWAHAYVQLSTLYDITSNNNYVFRIDEIRLLQVDLCGTDSGRVENMGCHLCLCGLLSDQSD